jgi:hypothetical protein
MKFDRPDGNKADLVEFMNAMGASWRDTPSTGRGGGPDGIVGYHGVDCQAEIKSETGVLSDKQLKFSQDMARLPSCGSSYTGRLP